MGRINPVELAFLVWSVSGLVSFIWSISGPLTGLVAGFLVLVAVYRQ